MYKHGFKILITEDGAERIAFTDLPESKNFIAHVMEAFSGINISIVNYDDLWMNDEIALKAASDAGEFTIYRDVDGYYTITCADVAVMPRLAEILRHNNHFEEVEK